MAPPWARSPGRPGRYTVPDRPHEDDGGSRTLRRRVTPIDGGYRGRVRQSTHGNAVAARQGPPPDRDSPAHVPPCLSHSNGQPRLHSSHRRGDACQNCHRFDRVRRQPAPDASFRTTSAASAERNILRGAGARVDTIRRTAMVRRIMARATLAPWWESLITLAADVRVIRRVACSGCDDVATQGPPGPAVHRTRKVQL